MLMRAMKEWPRGFQPHVRCISQAKTFIIYKQNLERTPEENGEMNAWPADHARTAGGIHCDRPQNSECTPSLQVHPYINVIVQRHL